MAVEKSSFPFSYRHIDRIVGRYHLIVDLVQRTVLNRPMTHELTLLIESLQKVKPKWLLLTSSTKWKPKGYAGEINRWLDFLIARVEQDQVSIMDIEDLKTAFGGYGLWTWVKGDEEPGNEIVSRCHSTLKIILNQKGRTLISAAKHLFDGLAVADLEDLIRIGIQLGFDRAETGALLWALSQDPQFQWLEPFYNVSQTSHPDPREDLELSGYKLAPKGVALLRSLPDGKQWKSLN